MPVGGLSIGVGCVIGVVAGVKNVSVNSAIIWLGQRTVLSVADDGAEGVEVVSQVGDGVRLDGVSGDKEAG